MEYVKKCMCWDCQERRDNGFMSHPGHDDRVSGSRDDLIRLVVGMQWQIAMAQAIVVEVHSSDGTLERCAVPQWNGVSRGAISAPIADRTAADIVDEWLGVRK